MAIGAVTNAARDTDAFLYLASAFQQMIDRDEFLLHWRIAYAFVSVAAIAAFVAGLSMVLVKRWSYLLLSATALGIVIVQCAARLTGYIRYGFESMGLVSALVLLA